MKSKLVILSLFMAGAAVTATAQTKEKFTSEKAGDNIFISVGVGAKVRTTDDNMDNFGKAISPNITLSVGKWFSPIWGVRGQATWSKMALFTDYNNGTFTKDKISFGDVQDMGDRNYISVHADALLNLSHLFAGYNSDRLFNLSLFAGPGLNFAKGYNKGTEQLTVQANSQEGTWVRKPVGGEPSGLKALVNGSVGLLGQFNVSNHWDINLEVRGEIGTAPYTRMAKAYADGALAATLGASYTFGGKKFVSCGAKVDGDALNDEINKYRQQLADAERELAATKNALANVKPQTKEVVKEIQVAGPRAIFFQIGKSVIDDYGMVNIKLAADILKANTGKKYKIAGYADKATGSSGWNQKLSEKRAQAVYDALIKEGVSSDQLELVGYGGTANMFGQNKLNRVVILE